MPQWRAKENAMKQWIRWWGLGVFLFIALFWWLCIDFIVKTTIETVGTQAVGAKVELAEASVTLLPASLTLKQLRITNADAPMQNIVEVGNISASIDSLELFGRRLVINEMDLSGLQFNTPRKSSGATSDRSTAGSDESIFDLGGVIPGMSLPDVNSLIEKEKQAFLMEYEDISNNLQAVEAGWQQRIDGLPDDAQIEEYNQRWKKAKKGNILQKASAIKSLKKDIDKDLSDIKSLKKQLAEDTKTVKSELNRANNLPSTQTQRILSDVGLGSAEGDFTSAILGDQLKPLLQQSLNYLKQMSGAAPQQPEEPVYARGKGTWVTFKEDNPVPELLIKLARLDGVFSIAKQDIHFTGQAQDLSHQPALWHKPASFQLKGQSADDARLVAQGVLDHRETVSKDSLDVSLESFPLVDYAISEKADLQIMINKALSDFSAKLDLEGEVILADIKSGFSDLELQVNSDNPGSSTSVISDTLSTLNAFDMALKVTGTLNNPAMSLSSDLDNILGKALKSKLNEQAAALKDELTAAISQQMSPELEKLTQQGDFIGQLDKQLGDKQDALKQLTKAM
jgi:uncharacterized protein (TIGR03545 family)